MIDSEKFFTYLKNKIPNFVKTSKGGKVLFSCPKGETHKFQKDMPSMFPKSGCDKFYCGACGLTATIYDCVRLLENDKKSFSDGQIIEYLINTTKMELFPELDEYKKYGWFLFVIAKNGKMPIKEEHWRQKEFTSNEKSKWLGWLESGYNLAVNCEFSNVMIVDFDDKEVAPEFLSLREEIKKLLDNNKTLIQNSPRGGKHYVFEIDEELCFKQKVNLGGGLMIDTRTHKGYFLVAPSKLNNVSYNWVNLGSEIKKVNPELKAKLLEIIKVDKGRSEEITPEMKQIIDHPIELVSNNLMGQCNDTFVQFGGALLKMGIIIDKVKGILFYLNKHWLKNPMPTNVIEAMIGSLDGYKKSEIQTQYDQVIECCELLELDITSAEVERHTELKKNMVNKLLSQLHKEGKLIRKKQGRYDIKEKVSWTNEEQPKLEEVKFEVPYFNNIARFRESDMIILGAFSGKGKTTIAINMIKQLRNQGIIPYYISLESGSRHEVTRELMGLTCKDYYISKNPVMNPAHISLEENVVTIIDWLNLGEDFSATPVIFKHLSDEMRIKKGLLIVFTQIREDGKWFAPDLINQFARFSAKFRIMDELGKFGLFDVDKMTEARGQYLTATVQTEFDFDTKELKLKNNL